MAAPAPGLSALPPVGTRHRPVMLAEVLAALAPAPGMHIVDGTFGAGGYSRALLEAGADVIAIDRDPDAIAAGRAIEAAAGGHLTLVHGRFSDLDIHAAGVLADDAFTQDGSSGGGLVDGVVLDIGVSSMQLDEADRGFSFRFDGPLDMRMSQEGPDAADLVNHLPEADLARLLWLYGEERRSRAVARAIVARRAEQPFTRTLDLAGLIARVVPKSGDGIHPATRSFQGLRIAVNRELDELIGALAAAERALKPGGRLAVVSFHSLEDRIVKRFLADRSRERAGGSRHMPEASVPPATFRLESRGVTAPGEDEIRANPRARSARLRAAVRTQAPARALAPAEFGVPPFDATGEV